VNARRYSRGAEERNSRPSFRSDFGSSTDTTSGRTSTRLSAALPLAGSCSSFTTLAPVAQPSPRGRGRLLDHAGDAHGSGQTDGVPRSQVVPTRYWIAVGVSTPGLCYTAANCSSSRAGWWRAIQYALHSNNTRWIVPNNTFDEYPGGAAEYARLKRSTWKCPATIIKNAATRVRIA